jgi:pimeloyl-ACP methyl ester carboxylesterase
MPSAQVAGRKVYYELHGEDRDATPLLLVMGVGGSCRGWLPLQVPEFSAVRPTLIYENRGVGASEDDGRPFTTADLAEDAVGLLDVLGVARAHVLGAFMGGMVAQELALSHPARLDGLVLVGTYARPDAKRRMILEDWAQLARAGTPWEVFIRKRLLWTLQDETLEQTDLIESMIEYFRNEGSPLSADLFARQCEACIAHDTFDRLRRIRAPTLVVCGRHDQLTPPRFHRELADEIPDARLVTISYGAHAVMVESAERFNATVLQFLDEVEAGRAGASGS